MNGQKKAAVTVESVEMTLRHFVENGGLHLTAFYECANEKLKCTLGGNWQVHGVTISNDEFSFIASQGEQKPVKFMVRMKNAIELVLQWFKETAEKMKPGLEAMFEATIPQKIVFSAGTTEYVKKK